MKMSDALLAAFSSLRSNLLRSLLTALGVVIGVAAVVALLSVGGAAEREINKLIGGLGANLIVAFPGSGTVGGAMLGIGTRPTLTLADAAALAAEVPSAQVIAPVVQGGGQIVAGGANWAVRIFGVTPDYLEARDLALALGRGIEPADLAGGLKTVVLGHNVARELFGAVDPVGASVRLGRVPFRVVGVLEEQGSSGFGQSQDDVVFIPLSTAVRRVLDRGELARDRVDLIFIKARSADLVAATEAQASRVLRASHRLRPDAPDDFVLQNLTQVLAAGLDAARQFGFLLGAIGAISLLVGGIGIMNIMLVSVTERTREIGLRLAVGARRRDIERQFLIEAVALCLLGGLLGVLLGIGASAVFSAIAGWSFAVDGGAILLAFGAAAAVGLFFGAWPARKAARLDPIEALRHD